MNSIKDLKEELENVEMDLSAEATNLATLEELVATLKKKRDKLVRVLNILEDKTDLSEPMGSPVSPSPAVATPAAPTPPPYTGPRCSACGGKLVPAYKTTRSGVMVSLMQCQDSGCNNEVYSA